MKNTAANNWKETGIVKGVEVKQLPNEGCAVYDYIGSDVYGYQIGKVADDGASFKILDEDGNDRGTAVLITRKNSRDKGFYAFANANGKPSTRILSVTAEVGCGKTVWDPSF